MILVDTSVWSLAFRRRRRDLNPQELRAFYAWEGFIKTGDAAIIGPIRQETLSGIANPDQFVRLKERLDIVIDLPLDKATFVRAAQFFNICRSHGVAGGDIDMVICAAAFTYRAEILTTDSDFARYASHLPISIYQF